MKPADDIKRFFKNAGLTTDPAADKAVFDKVLKASDTKNTNPANQPNIWSIIMQSKMARSGAVAASLLIGLFLWFTITLPPNITLADVQESINSKAWILLEYENGRKEWFDLNEKKSFSASVDKNGSNYCRSMRDHVNGLQRTYHSNWGYQIHEFSFTPKPFPQTPWEYVTSGWDDEGVGKSIPHIVEEFTDTIDGHQVIRFDTYDIGPLDIRVLAQQIWADPETRLPIRIRENMGWRRPSEVNTFRTGDFSFPEDGPSTIFDLGAPKDLEVVTNWGIIEPEARSIIDAAKKALRNFPGKMRIVRKHKYRVYIYYRLDNKFREETYALIGGKHNDSLPIDYPESNEQIYQWAKDNLTLLELALYDGRYEYKYDSGAAHGRDRQEQTEITLHVEQRDNDDWTNVLLPIRDQWPYTHSVGPMRVLENDPEMPPGCVLLQAQGSKWKRNWYIDPERDYICIKQIDFHKDETGKWMEGRRVLKRQELTRLPTGQWYARFDNEWGDTREFDVRQLTDSDFELLCGQDGVEGFFNGEKLLKEAIDAGADITFWAR